MNHSKISATSNIAQWADRQLTGYDARQPGSIFAEGIVLSVAEGYELQSAVARLRCERGERIIGYKVGCTSPTIRKQLGIDHCVTGRLFDTEHHSTGAVLSRGVFANLAIEGELAVELSHEPTVDDFTGAGIPTCVDRVLPVIELHHHVMRGERSSAGELIANNAINAGFVAGTGIPPDELSGQPSLAVLIDGQPVEHCEGPALIDTIRSSLEWLMQTLHARGERLAAGQIVLTGSIPSLIPVSKDCCVRVETSPFGSVDATFIE